MRCATASTCGHRSRTLRTRARGAAFRYELPGGGAHPAVEAAAGRARGPSDPVDVLRHFDTNFQGAVRAPQWKLRSAEPGSRESAGILQVEHTDIGQGLQLSPATGTLAGLDETIDLAEQRPEVVEELTAAHEQWLGEMRQSARALAV